jgi:hypothetical protein
MNRIRRTVASSVAAITAVAGLGMVAVSPAGADTVTMNESCGGLWIPLHTRVIEFTITAPATASPGQTVTVTINRIVDHNNVLTDARPAGQDHVDATITLGGAASGTVSTTRLASPALQAGEFWRAETGTAQVTMPASGEVTYLPDTWHIVNGGWQCWPPSGGTVPVAARTRVQ